VSTFGYRNLILKSGATELCFAPHAVTGTGTHLSILYDIFGFDMVKCIGGHKFVSSFLFRNDCNKRRPSLIYLEWKKQERPVFQT
jgi:hypothetical protein